MYPSFPRPWMTVLLLGLGLSGVATAAAPPQAQRATLQCPDRKIELQADCVLYAGHMRACTRQALRFLDSSGKVVGTRQFTPQPQETGDDYPFIEEKVSKLSCVETSRHEHYVVASMFNGGNCAQCEWTDVYSMDGALLGSTRTPDKRSAALTAALDAARDKQAKRVLGEQALRDFYRDHGARAEAPSPATGAQTPSAAIAAGPSATSCVARLHVPEDQTHEMVIMPLHNRLNDDMRAAIGPEFDHLSDAKVRAKVAQRRVDPAKMAELADAAACAAIIDVHSGCAGFYDEEFGDPLSVFMGMKKTAPLRRQFDQAVAAVADVEGRQAALQCISWVGKK